ncbi:hypothetical protein P4O66_012381 [Electrophorus voltai]|uniref:Uncharacterized protein n=1 Tax=Electrophorus voltai TaxID=2609070 RepID=A0AAD8Z4Q6_9TELE|nr:hypothetical protein P4O66_012381 [Electrophorus voltai]
MRVDAAVAVGRTARMVSLRVPHRAFRSPQLSRPLHNNTPIITYRNTYNGFLGKEKGRERGEVSASHSLCSEASRVLGNCPDSREGPGVEAGESYGTTWELDSMDSCYPAERPYLILVSLQGATSREEPTELFWGGPVHGPGSDFAESYGDQPDHEHRHSEMGSAGSYDPCLDNHYTDYGETGECSNVSLRSDMGYYREEDTPMDVEKDPHRDLPSHSDAKSSENDEPPAPKAPPKAPPRACHHRASKLPRVASRKALLSEKDTPPPKAKSPRAHMPMPKSRGGNKAAAPVPALERATQLVRFPTCMRQNQDSRRYPSQ